MERRDLDLIEQHLNKDEKLTMLYKEHLDFERALEKYNSKPYLTPQEEMERKTLQKKKLHGRDLIESILNGYRKKESLS